MSQSILLRHGVDKKNSTFYILEDIDRSTLNQVLTCLAELGNKDVTLVLSTDGGCVYSAFGIYDALRRFAGHVKIIAIGGVFSAGAIILQAADERIMTANSSLMIHFGFEVSGDMATKKQNDKMTKKMINLIIEAVDGKRATKTVKGWFNKESYFDARQALDAGLIDRVLENEFDNE